MRDHDTAWPLVRDGVERAVAAIRSGHLVVVVDDADREYEGDLIFAAELATTETLAFVIRHTSGFVCVALPEETCNRLDLPMMCRESSDKFGTAYRVTVDLDGQGTGISATDRAATIAALASRSAMPSDFTRPGHVIPLAAREGGVLARMGHTEAAVDLARLAGLYPAGGLCQIVSTDSPTEMARGPELERFAAEYNIEIISIADLVDYRRATEEQVRRHATAALPTAHGEFVAFGYRGVHDDAEHLALVVGDVQGADVPVYVHTECLTGDALGSRACDCGGALERSLDVVADEGCGVVVYMRPPGRPRACGLFESSSLYSGGFSLYSGGRASIVVDSILTDLNVTAPRPPHTSEVQHPRIDPYFDGAYRDPRKEGQCAAAMNQS